MINPNQNPQDGRETFTSRPLLGHEMSRVIMGPAACDIQVPAEVIDTSTSTRRFTFSSHAGEWDVTFDNAHKDDD